MDRFSEENIKKDCPHCDPDSFALKHKLKETDNFWITCDVHPIVKGHILIIPKSHLSSIGEYPDEIYKEFIQLNKEVTDFLIDQYGKVSSFEHGKIAQTVFHSHVHYFPFDGSPLEIINEGKKYFKKIKNLNELKKIFIENKKYLFFSIGKSMWVVDTSISAPRFFRDRFAATLGVPEKGNWKEMHNNSKLMELAEMDIENLKRKWGRYE